MEKETITAIPLEHLWLGIAVSVLGGIVAASHAFSKNRKSEEPLDWLDVFILTLSHGFAGFIGYLIAEWKLSNLQSILAVSGLSSIWGYNSLMMLRDIVFDVLKSYLSSKYKINSTSNNNNNYYEIEDYQTKSTQNDYRRDE